MLIALESFCLRVGAITVLRIPSIGGAVMLSVAFVVISIEVYADVLFCLHIYLALGLLSDNPVKMIDVVLVDIFDAKIVDDERERDFSGLVTEETFGVLGLDVVVFC